MRYMIHSEMMADITPPATRAADHPFLYRFQRAAAWLLAPICYLGLLVAPSVVLSLPFQVFHRVAVSPIAYWLVAGPVMFVILWVLYWLGRFNLQNIRQRVIDLEALIGLIGFALIPGVVVWFFPPK